MARPMTSSILIQKLTHTDNCQADINRPEIAPRSDASVAMIVVSVIMVSVIMAIAMLMRRRLVMPGQGHRRFRNVRCRDLRHQPAGKPLKPAACLDRQQFMVHVAQHPRRRRQRHHIGAHGAVQRAADTHILCRNIPRHRPAIGNHQFGRRYVTHNRALDLDIPQAV